MTPDNVPALHQELATLRRQVAEHGAILARQRHTGRARQPRRRAFTAIPALIALLVLVTLVPSSLLAAEPFADLDPASPHNGDIAAIREAGITRGCDPPGFTAYCPKGSVTREEMASFLARTAGLGGNPPVANAKTAQAAISAITADSVDGKHADELLRAAQGSSSGGTVTLINSPRTVVAVEIVAPGPGYVLVSADADVAYSTGGGGTCPCYVRYNVVEEGGANHGLDRWQSIPALPSGVVQTAEVVSTQWLFTMSAGGARTYTLQMARVSGAGHLFVGSTTITALYIPFGAAGNTP